MPEEEGKKKSKQEGRKKLLLLLLLKTETHTPKKFRHSKTLLTMSKRRTRRRRRRRGPTIVIVSRELLTSIDISIDIIRKILMLIFKVFVFYLFLNFVLYSTAGHTGVDYLRILLQLKRNNSGDLVLFSKYIARPLKAIRKKCLDLSDKIYDTLFLNKYIKQIKNDQRNRNGGFQSKKKSFLNYFL